jgi:hypothetical protein
LELIYDLLERADARAEGIKRAGDLGRTYF